MGPHQLTRFKIMVVTAALVKELRERTAAGMMECKRALVETGGNMEAAIEHLRKTGLAKADKKAGRVAAEGCIVCAVSERHGRAVLVEVNCETDFVAKDSGFLEFATAVGEAALASDQTDVATILSQTGGDGVPLEDTRLALISKIGENIQVRRAAAAGTGSGPLGTYVHGGRIGVAVEMSGGSGKLARDIAMHVAASRPSYVSADQVPEEELAKEKEILAAQARDSGKPEDIIEKMVAGRLRKHLNEITLLGQPFIKNPDQTVAQLLKEGGAAVSSFVRLEVGEGIEKKGENFAEEVMAQVRGV